MAQEQLGSIDIALSLDNSEFNRSIARTRREIRESRQDFRLLDAEVRNVERTEEGLSDALTRLNRHLDRQKQNIRQLENAMERLRREGKEDSAQFRALASSLRDARVDMERTRSRIGGITRELEGLEDSAQDAGNSIGGAFDSLGGAAAKLSGITAGIAGVVTAIGKIGTEAIKASEEFEKASKKIENTTGVVGKELEGLEENMRDLRKTGFTDDLNEAAEATKAMAVYFPDLVKGSEAFLELSQNALAYAKNMEVDVNEALNAAKQLTIDFGVSAEEAFDLLTVGAQNGADRFGDLLDTVNEYGPMFAEQGYNANEFLNILISGLNNGALNADKVADAIKEFPIALEDGRVEKALDSMSTKTQGLFKKYQNGKATTREVFDSIISDIENAESEEEARQIIVALGITQFEDLGIAGVGALNDISGAADTSGGKIDNLRKNSVTPLQKQLAHLKGSGKDAFEAIGDAINPIFTKVITLINLVSDLSRRLAEIARTKLSNLWSNVTGAFSRFGETRSVMEGRSLQDFTETRETAPSTPQETPTGGLINRTQAPLSGVSFTQNIHAPQQLSASEVAKETRRTLNQMAYSW